MALTELPEWVQWISALSPAGLLVIAVATALVAWRTLRQRSTADARAHWWERTQWALETSFATDQDVSLVGLHVLEVQATSELMRDEEYRLVMAVWDDLFRGTRRGEMETDVEYVLTEERQEVVGGEDDEHHHGQ
ncbi:hypothetical protein [Georgenia yuyongxinii]|uniref:Uncharacterized protein n=1 Tax=Georgenia yuyongxinii TaxID=2589797 RepID=A0A552WXP3_9MICO|nr:hypothetical protein [Georgenia yuyongxinii]TRW47544.1 hypothetical protein FJ693_00055 [Georgenia yuyongxinii]